MSAETARVAAAICRACHIQPDRFDDAVQETWVAMVGAPRARRVAAGARVVRRHLAAQLSVPARNLGTDLAAIKRIGQYEAERAHAAADGPDGSGRAQFDYHSRRFALENQVCPRCGRPGRFDPPGRDCPCGWSL
jgi:hypothetical protein